MPVLAHSYLHFNLAGPAVSVDTAAVTVDYHALAAVTAAPGAAAGAGQAAGVSAGGPVNPSWDPSGSYTLTFDDEFTGTSYDDAWQPYWYFFYSGSGDLSGGGQYMMAAYSASHVTMPGDGYLHMLLDGTPNTVDNWYGDGTSCSYTGACMATRTTGTMTWSQVGGCFEARVYVPGDGSGKVIGWPVWWIKGNSWDGEQDIMEGGWGAGLTEINVHYDDYATNASWSSATPQTGWHTFGVDWDSAGSTVTYYWDGAQVYTHAYTATSPHFLVLDYQMHTGAVEPGGGAVMLVDWVRAWQPA